MRHPVPTSSIIVKIVRRRMTEIIEKVPIATTTSAMASSELVTKSKLASARVGSSIAQRRYSMAESEVIARARSSIRGLGRRPVRQQSGRLRPATIQELGERAERLEMKLSET